MIKLFNKFRQPFRILIICVLAWVWFTLTMTKLSEIPNPYNGIEFLGAIAGAFFIMMSFVFIGLFFVMLVWKLKRSLGV